MEELLILNERLIFDVEKVKRANFIRAKSSTWQEWRNGLIVKATPEKIKVIFLTETTSAAMSYFTISLEDVKNNLWEILVSEDLMEVAGYGLDTQEAEGDGGSD